MSTIGEAVAFLFPAANAGIDFRCEDRGDGQGERITMWNAPKLGTQPTLSQINQAKTDVDTAKTAAANTLSTERTALANLRTKLLADTDLTAAELRIAIRLLIRRSLLRD